MNFDTQPMSTESVIPIGEARYRQRALVSGRVRSMRVQSWSDVPTLEVTLVDETGGLVLVFGGRTTIPGLDLGSSLTAEGMVGELRGTLAILNPAYQLLAHQ